MLDTNKKIIYNYTDGFVDFPNKYAITLYFIGCNLKCPFCYNKELLKVKIGNYSIQNILDKKKEIDENLNNNKVGVVFSGGEPTLQKNFTEIINIFKSNPLSIHTNGLILPTYNPFESVILSLKTKECGVNKNYVENFKRALYFYEYSNIKQIIVVKIKKYMSEYVSYLSQLKDDIIETGFEIKFVDCIKN